MITDKDIDNGRPFDWGKTSMDYAKFRDIYPDVFYEKIINLGLCVEGQKVLDLGTGTGVLPRNMYKYGAEFTAADISENQILQAKLLAEQAHINIDFIVSSAENIDFPDETFDVVTACQCFMYFNNAVVLPKIYNLLKPDGHFCILFMGWLPYESEIAKKSEDLILKYNPDWKGAGMTRSEIAFPEEAQNLFEIQNSFIYDLNLTFTRESWHGRMKACRGMGASSLSKSEVQSWEQEHLKYLKTVPEVFSIIHWAAVMNLRKKQLL